MIPVKYQFSLVDNQGFIQSYIMIHTLWWTCWWINLSCKSPTPTSSCSRGTAADCRPITKHALATYEKIKCINDRWGSNPTQSSPIVFPSSLGQEDVFHSWAGASSAASVFNSYWLVCYWMSRHRRGDDIGDDRHWSGGGDVGVVTGWWWL